MVATTGINGGDPNPGLASGRRSDPQRERPGGPGVARLRTPDPPIVQAAALKPGHR